MPSPAALQFKGLRDPIEVFRVGTHTDKRGKVAEFTAADLDQMAANVTGTGVPSVIGHPTETAPAWAWGKLRRDGDSLYYEAADIVPAFESWVDAGHYRERSISVSKDPARGWVVQHVGWLGAQAPALDLAPLSYSAPAGAELLEFSAGEMGEMLTGWALSDVGRLLRGLRDWLISSQGLDTADKVLPDYAITSVAEAGRRVAEEAAAEAQAEATATPMYSAAPAAGAHTMPASKEELEAARLEGERVAREQLQQQFSAQGAELAELRAERQRERIGTQINGWKAAGKLLPAEEAGLAEFMAALEGGSTAEFAFSRAGAEAKLTPAAFFAAFMDARGPLVKLGHREDEGAAVQLDTSDYTAISRAAQQYIADEAKAGRTVGAAEAVAHVTSQAKA